MPIHALKSFWILRKAFERPVEDFVLYFKKKITKVLMCRISVIYKWRQENFLLLASFFLYALQASKVK